MPVEFPSGQEQRVEGEVGIVKLCMPLQGHRAEIVPYHSKNSVRAPQPVSALETDINVLNCSHYILNWHLIFTSEEVGDCKYHHTRLLRSMKEKYRSKPINNVSLSITLSNNDILKRVKCFVFVILMCLSTYKLYILTYIYLPILIRYRRIEKCRLEFPSVNITEQRTEGEADIVKFFMPLQRHRTEIV